MIDISTLPTANKLIHKMIFKPMKIAEGLIVVRYNGIIIVKKKRNSNITFSVIHIIIILQSIKDKVVLEKLNTSRENNFIIVEIDES